MAINAFNVHSNSGGACGHYSHFTDDEEVRVIERVKNLAKVTKVQSRQTWALSHYKARAADPVGCHGSPCEWARCLQSWLPAEHWARSTLALGISPAGLNALCFYLCPVCRRYIM